MRFVIFGLSLSSSWGNGHATTHRALLPALAARGHRIVFYEKDVDYYARRRDFDQVSYAELRLYRAWEDIRQQALEEAANADVVITTSFCPSGSRIQEELLLLRERQGAAAGFLNAFYDLDTPVTIEGLSARSPAVLDYLLPQHIPRFDLYLSFTGGPFLEKVRQRWGARRVAPLYLCIDPEAYHTVQPSQEFYADLSYLGTYSPDRQERLQEFLLGPAALLPDLRFTIAGSMYPPDLSWPDNLRRFDHLSPTQHPAFYCSSRFTLNITRSPMIRAGWSPQGRLFEAALCGTPIVTDGWPGLEQFFVPGQEIVVASSHEDVVHCLREMTESKRREMARRARQKVIERHTGTQRARELEALVTQTAAALAS